MGGYAGGCYGRVFRFGTTSVTLKVVFWYTPRTQRGEPQKPGFQGTAAIFTYVAVV